MKKIFVLLFSIVFCLSCSLEYDTSVSDEFSESVPSSILYEVEQIEVKNGVPKASFSAEEARVWDEREDTELFSVQFREYNEQREIVTDGTADFLLIGENNDAVIKGDISGYSVKNEASIEAQELEWLDEPRELSSSGESSVTISLDGGTILQGAGFSADFYTNTVSFTSRVEGEIQTGSDDE